MAKKTKAPLVWSAQPLTGETQYINSVAVSADASKLIAGTYYFDYSTSAHSVPGQNTTFTVGIFFYDKTGQALWKDEFQASEGVYWVGLSRDGAWGAGGGLELHGQGFISAYNTATGAKAFEYKTPARTNMVALDGDGSVMVAGADSLYIFRRTAAGWNGTPQIVKCPQANDSVISVGVSVDGTWIVAGTLKGTVMLIKNNGGTLSAPVSWVLQGGTIHWIAIAADGSSFAAGGTGSSIYYFSVANFQAHPQPAWTGELTGCNSVRSVAISDDGTLVSAVANKAKTGMVFLFGAGGAVKWSEATKYSPNSTSLDGAGKYVSVASGYPDGSPGEFQLFDGNGKQLWGYATKNMSWPMQVAATGDAIAAGSDDAHVYYFTPAAK